MTANHLLLTAAIFYTIVVTIQAITYLTIQAITYLTILL